MAMTYGVTSVISLFLSIVGLIYARKYRGFKIRPVLKEDVMKNVSVYIGAVAIMEFEKKEFIFVPDLPSYVPGIISTISEFPGRTDCQILE